MQQRAHKLRCFGGLIGIDQSNATIDQRLPSIRSIWRCPQSKQSTFPFDSFRKSAEFGFLVRVKRAESGPSKAAAERFADRWLFKEGELIAESTDPPVDAAWGTF